MIFAYDEILGTDSVKRLKEILGTDSAKGLKNKGFLGAVPTRSTTHMHNGVVADHTVMRKREGAAHLPRPLWLIQNGSCQCHLLRFIEKFSRYFSRRCRAFCPLIPRFLQNCRNFVGNL